MVVMVGFGKEFFITSIYLIHYEILLIYHGKIKAVFFI